MTKNTEQIKKGVDYLIEYHSVDPEEFSKAVLMSSDKNETIENKLELYIEARNKAREYNQILEKVHREKFEKEAKEAYKKWEEEEKNKSFLEHFKAYIESVFSD